MRISASSRVSLPDGYKQEEYFAYGPKQDMMNFVET